MLGIFSRANRRRSRGFADVVVVFRHESVHEWPPLDKFRLRLLITKFSPSTRFVHNRAAATRH
jgi:hypothetical protein